MTLILAATNEHYRCFLAELDVVVVLADDARVLQSADQGVEDVGDGARDLVAVGQKPLVGLVGEGSVAVELEFVEDMVGG